MNLRLLALMCATLFTAAASAQQTFFKTITDGGKYPTNPSPVLQNIRKYAVIDVNEAALRTYLQAAPMEFKNKGVTLPLEIPMPNGTVETFGIVESPILSPEIAASNPEIKTYCGNGLKNKAAIIRLSLTSSGFNAIILNVDNDNVYFEPYKKYGQGTYVNYFTRDTKTPTGKDRPAGCEVKPRARGGRVNILDNPNATVLTPDNNTGANLRTYRWAIASTGEFTEVHPGADAAAKQQSTYDDLVAFTNRMNAVYRNEMAFAFQIVSGTNVIYPDKTTDPYTTVSSDMLNQCQIDLDTKVGSVNYDVGHVMSQSAGSGEGLAQADACGAAKAKGVTKNGGTPYAQVFFDQTLFHEVGHQFGMNHSFNSIIPVCTTRNQPTSVEPGAGATIMSYGFTCDGDDYFSSTTDGPILIFHTINYSEALIYIVQPGQTCGTVTATGNTPPTVTTPSAYTVPKSTPYALTGTATDAEGDALTYGWEGTNIGTVADPTAGTLANTAVAPFSRTYAPLATASTRNFPLLSAIQNGTNYAKGDKLPSVAATMTHRLTVRDNRAGGGGTAFQPVTVTVDGASGPFLITNDWTGMFVGGSMQTITWSVNNTNAAPVNCTNVNIKLSTDGGLTFPTTLLANAPNSGTANVMLPTNPGATGGGNPNLPESIASTTTARVKVEAVGNVFFDMSNSNFEITSVLSVELTDFNVRLKNKNEAALTWATASEKNNQGFEIEMMDANSATQTFEKIGFVKGNNTTLAANNYAFNVPNLLPSTYYFRLKQLDFDGKTRYSSTKSVAISGNNFDAKVFPNPTKSDLNLEFYLEKESAMTVTLINQIGQIVFDLPVKKYDAGRQIVLLNTANLPSGVYFYRCEAAQASVQGKVVIAK